MKIAMTCVIRLPLLVLAISCFAGDARAQEPNGEQIETASDVAMILARPPVAALPPLDCLHCYGPSPRKYCLPGFGPRGFLYYGTYLYDDDWFNGFDDCPGETAAIPAQR